MTERDLPAAAIAGRRDWRTLARSLAIAAAIGCAGAMLAANALAGLFVVAIAFALWMHRRHVAALDDRAPSPPVRRAPARRARSKEETRLQWIIACAVFGIVIAIQVPWSSLIDHTTLATVLIVGTMAMAFRRS